MINNLKVGDSASLSKTFTEEDVIHFANISTDTNPIHLDKRFAADSVFGHRVVHGILIASLFSALIGVKLPGEGTIYLGQSLRFIAPVSIGELVTASVEIVHIRKDKPVVTLRTLCMNSKEQIVVDGEAVVKVT